MLKIEKEFVSYSGRRYVRELNASMQKGAVGDNEKVIWRCENKRIRQGRYLSIEQWLDIEVQVREAYAMEYDVDFTSIFEIYPRDYTGVDGVIFYETYLKGDEQFGHSSNIEHIGAVGSYVPKPKNAPKRSANNYTNTSTTSFAVYRNQDVPAVEPENEEEQAEPHPSTRPRSPEPQRVIQINYAALGIQT